jgi:hypothetical protein
MEKVSRPDMKQSDLKNQLADNIVNIAKEYVDDDEKYFPLGKLYMYIIASQLQIINLKNLSNFN